MATVRALGEDLDAAFSAHAADPSLAAQSRLRAVLARRDRLFDLRRTPAALRQETGRAAFTSLKDVLMRLPAIDPASLPGESASAPDRLRLPGTEIAIVRVEDGPDRGAFLFSADTVERLPAFRERIIDHPVLNPTPYESWRDEQIRFTGPFVPWALSPALPPGFQILALGTPLWKVVATLVLFALAVWLAAQWTVVALRRAAATRGRVSGQLWRLSVPFVAWLLILLARANVNGQIIFSGNASHIAQAVSLAGLVLTLAWVARGLIALVAEAIVAAPAFVEHDYDSHLVRLLSRVAGLVAAAAVVVYGANLLGVPLLGLVAGVGVGGFALALAAQSTVENLFGGVSIFADRPFRVGDFIIYPDGQHYVEANGPRSTRIRGLDGMQITVPKCGPRQDAGHQQDDA
jgi:MscS family membrane protein